MKKVFFLFFFIITLSAKAQTSVYHPFPDSNAVWNINYDRQWYCHTTTILYQEKYSIVLSGDTIINSKIYHKLFVPFIWSSDTSCWLQNTNGYKGSIRQDTSLRQVYIVQPGNNFEELLYDFNLQVGDSVKGVFFHCPIDTVVSIDSVLVGNDYRKRWNIDSWYARTLIEGIGSDYGLIEHDPCMVTDMPGYTIECFQQNGVKLYPSWATSCNLISGVNSFSEKNISISIYPNPANNKITVSGYLLSGKEARIEIYNMMGEKVYSGQLQTSPKRSGQANLKPETAVDVSALTSGVYIIRLSDGEAVHRAKVVKE